MSKKLLKYAVWGIALFLVLRLFFNNEETSSTPRDYAAIAANGILHAVTEYNTLSFHIADDTISGFHYELIQAFAQDHGLQVEVSPEMSFQKRLKGVVHGLYDVIAYGLPNTSQLKDSLLLTIPIILSRQVLVQRKPTSEDSTHYIRSQLELAGQTLHVVKGSPAILRIHHLASEIADTIYIKEVERYGDEQLITMVAHGDIAYAVCDENIVHQAIQSLPQLDSKTAISFTQFYSWGVSKQSPVLLDSLNTWLTAFKASKTYKDIYQHYYK